MVSLMIKVHFIIFSKVVIIMLLLLMVWYSLGGYLLIPLS